MSAWLYINSANLLSPNAELIWMQSLDFWNTFGPPAASIGPVGAKTYRSVDEFPECLPVC